MKRIYMLFFGVLILLAQQGKAQFNCYFCGFLDLGGPVPDFDKHTVKWSWSTDGEFDADKFEVERSLNNPNTFQVVGVISAHVSTSGNTDYDFTDANPYGAGRSSGTNYYRLRLYKTDGSSDVSDVKSLDLQDLSNCHTCTFLSQCQLTSLTGPSTICNSFLRFDINNSPEPVTWSISNSNIASITQRGPTAVNVTKVGEGEVILTATFTTCGQLTKSIMIGLVNPSAIYLDYQDCIGGTDWDASFHTSPAVTNMTYLWSVNGSSFFQGPATYSLNQSNDPSVSLDIKYQNSCGTTAPLSSQFGGNPVTYYSPCPGYRATIFPNPAKDYLSVKIENNRNRLHSIGRSAEVFIYDFSYSTLIKRQKLRMNSETLRVPINFLKPGNYIVVISYAQEKIIKKFVVK